MKFCKHCQQEYPLTKEHWASLPRRAECKIAIRQRASVWKNKNKERVAAYNLEYEAQESRKERKRYHNRIRGNTYRKNNILAKMLHNLRKRTSRALRKTRHPERISKVLGCSVNYFKEYIAEQFRDGMSWDNYGTVWELDHILPLANYDLSDRATLRRLCHYTNLQPLLAHENRLKSNKEDY